MSVRRLSVILVLLFLLIGGVGVWLGLFLGEFDPASPSPYSMVTTVGGDVYFGRLRWFPWLRLEEVWVLQRGVDAQGQVQFSVAPLRSSFPAPVGALQMNPRNVVSWVRLRRDSQVVRAIQDAGARDAPSAPTPPPNQ